MSGDGDVDTERTPVRTYVPAYQKAEWEREAERMDMSLSEFVRTMVQAGRRGFPSDETQAETSDEDSADLEGRVIQALADAGSLAFEELVAEVTGDVEARVEETLQTSDHVQHSPRQGGYVLTEEP